MVFVHARNQTVKTANFLKQSAGKQNLLQLFQSDKERRSRLWKTKNNFLTDLFSYGIGVHHAGTH